MQPIDKAHRRSLLPVFLTFFLDNFGLAIVYPIFTPLLLQPNLFLPNASGALIERTVLLGLIIGAFPLAQFFGAPLIGQFSDRFGRKKAFYCTILGMAFGYTITAVAIMRHSIEALFIGRFLTGLFAGNLTLCLAAIADMSPDEKSRTKNFGLIAAIGGVSFVAAIMLGGILSDKTISIHFNPSFPFWVTAAMSFLNFFCMITLFKETHPTKVHLGLNVFKGMHNLTLGLQNHSVRTIYFVNFLFMLSWVPSMQFLPTVLMRRFDLDTLHVTYALAIVGVLWSLANILLNRQLTKRFHPGQTFLICLFLLTACLIIGSLPWNTLHFFTLFYPAVACASLCWTNGLATVSLKASPEIQGSILGMNQSLSSVAAMLGPPIGGVLLNLGDESVFIFAALCCFSGFWVLWKSKLYLHTH